MNVVAKAHNLLDTSLNVKTAGLYSGKWNYKSETGTLFRDTKQRSEKLFHADRLERDYFPITDIVSIEVLTETKNISGIAKAAVAGAVVGGATGALAGGAFSAAKNSHFVELSLGNGEKLHGHISQETYEVILMQTRSASGDPGFIGIKQSILGEEDNTLVTLAGLGFLLFMVIMMLFSDS